MRTHWNRRPLLVRGALAGFEFPIGEVFLKKMAFDSRWSSRIILEQGKYEPWEVQYGPFKYSHFDALPEKGWTLLVSDTDRCHKEVAALMDLFRFVPNWRLDDVQVSFAAPGGSAGPHVDEYDVFLVQGYGHRRWQIESKRARKKRPVRTDTDLAILTEFEPDKEWILGPGDLLYLPPRFPHWGIALDTCMTYSVGFRVPSEQELVFMCLEELAESVPAEARFQDRRRGPTSDPGRIDAPVLSWVCSTMESLLTDHPGWLERLFCRHMTMPKRHYFPEGFEIPVTRKSVIRSLEHGGAFERSAAAHLAYACFDDSTMLFALGLEYELPPHLIGFAQLITGTERLDLPALRPYLEEEEAIKVLAHLLTSGALYEPNTID